MNKQEDKKLIKEMLDNKELTKEQCKILHEKIELFSKDQDEKIFYNKYKAQLLLKEKEYKVAKIYFRKLATLKKNSKLAYHNLYKIAIIENKYELALLNLKEYEMCFEKGKVSIDLEQKLIELYLKEYYKSDFDYKIDKIESSNLFGSRNITDEKALSVYRQVINYCNNNDYTNMLNSLKELDMLSKKSSLNINFETVIKIAEDLNRKIELKDNKKKSNNIYKTIDKLIGIDIDVAYDLVKKIDNPKTNDAKLYKSYVENKILEEKKFLALSEENKKVYKECIKDGHDAVYMKDFLLALNYYKAGLFITGHPIFNYYIGKIYYKRKQNNDAYKYLSKYNEIGGKKYPKCNLYLFLLEKENNELEKAEARRKVTNKVNKAFNNKKIEVLEDQEKKKPKAEKEKSLKLTINKDLEIENYYNYSIKDKLKIIKQLYENKKIKIADKLMTELEQEKEKTKEEKQLIQNEKNNKVLYINRSKYMK